MKSATYKAHHCTKCTTYRLGDSASTDAMYANTGVYMWVAYKVTESRYIRARSKRCEGCAWVMVEVTRVLGNFMGKLGILGDMNDRPFR